MLDNLAVLQSEDVDYSHPAVPWLSHEMAVLND